MVSEETNPAEVRVRIEGDEVTIAVDSRAP
jgi:hypothetical protein